MFFDNRAVVFNAFIDNESNAKRVINEVLKVFIHLKCLRPKFLVLYQHPHRTLS